MIMRMLDELVTTWSKLLLHVLVVVQVVIHCTRHEPLHVSALCPPGAYNDTVAGFCSDCDAGVFCTAYAMNRKGGDGILLPGEASTTVTLAGSGGRSCLDGIGQQAVFNMPMGIVSSPGQFLYVADTMCNSIRRVNRLSARVDVVAGNFLAPGNADGIGLNSSFYAPQGIAIDNYGFNLYVADTQNHIIRAIVLNNFSVTTFAGIKSNSGFIDSSNRFAAKFNAPVGICVNSNNDIFVADSGNNVIRKIESSSGAVSTVAGSPIGDPSFKDGIGTNAAFSNPQGITLLVSTLFVADQNNNRIRVINLMDATVTTLAGSGSRGAIDSIGLSATFFLPSNIALDPSSQVLYVSDQAGNRIRSINLTSKQVITVAGSGSIGNSDGVGSNSAFSAPVGITVHSTGLVYVVDSGNGVIRSIQDAALCQAGRYCSAKSTSALGSGACALQSYCPAGSSSATALPCPSGRYCNGGASSADGSGACAAGFFCPSSSGNRFGGFFSPTSTITKTIAGTSQYGWSDGIGTNAVLCNPRGVVISQAIPDVVFFADSCSHRIRKIHLSSLEISSIAGGAQFGFLDGFGTHALFNEPIGLAICGRELIYIADSKNHAIRVLNITSTFVSTIAGSGSSGFQDNVGPLASFNSPLAIAVDQEGMFIFVADTGNHIIRKITISNRLVTTIAGQGGVSGNVSATGISSRLFSPSGIALDVNNNILVADTENNCLRSISSSTLFVSYFACTLLSKPHGLSVDKAGNIFIADYGSNRILVADPQSAQVTVFAGTGTFALVDSTLPSASFNVPTAVAVDADENVFVADYGNNRIRSIPYFASRACMAGFFCPGGSSAEVSCPPSLLCAKTSTVTPAVCPAGLFCPGGSSAGVVCPAGYFCPAGSAAGVPCTPGYFANSTGLASAIPCPAGYFCANMLQTSTSGVCPAGSYCQTASSVQSLCTPGTWSNKTGLSSQSDCFDCPAGMFCEGGRSSVSGTCSAGFYCPAKSSSPTALICPPGMWSSQTGLTSVSSCTICTGGEFCSGGASTISGKCLSKYYCPAGSSSPTAFECRPSYFCPSGSAEQILCPAGFYCASSLLSTPTAACPSGAYCPPGSSQPNPPCTAGFFCSTGSGVQNPCSVGYFCPGSGFQVECPAGSVCNSTQLTAPVPCPAGYVCASTGLSSPSSVCSSGYFCPESSTSPTTCPKGYFCNQPKLSSPIDCPAGLICSISGLTAVSAVCPAGKYSLPKYSTCLSCPSGLYNPNTGSSTCILCPSGMSPGKFIGAQQCSPCSDCRICFLGSPASYPEIKVSALSVPSNRILKAHNPFERENIQNQSFVVDMGNILAYVFIPFVTCIIGFGVAAEKSASVKSCFTCNSRFDFKYLDFLFKKSHFRPVGSTLLVEQTSFGAFMTIACVISVTVAAVILGISNMMFPVYSSSISSQPPEWSPHGTFRLAVQLIGFGLENCSSSNIRLEPVQPSDWSSTTSSFVSYSSQEEACQLEWVCSGFCELQSASPSVLRLSALGNAKVLVSYVSFSLFTPAFTSGPRIAAGVDAKAFSVSGEFTAPVTSLSNLSALGGYKATQISIGLTPLILKSRQGSTEYVAAEPAVNSIVYGSVVSRHNFNFIDQAGFEIDFVIQRVPFSINFSVSNLSLVNFLVLLASLSGSFMSFFSLLIGWIENLCNLHQNASNPMSEAQESQLIDKLTDNSSTFVCADTDTASASTRTSIESVLIRRASPPLASSQHQIQLSDSSSNLHIVTSTTPTNSSFQSLGHDPVTVSSVKDMLYSDPLPVETRSDNSDVKAARSHNEIEMTIRPNITETNARFKVDAESTMNSTADSDLSSGAILLLHSKPELDDFIGFDAIDEIS